MNKLLSGAFLFSGVLNGALASALYANTKIAIKLKKDNLDLLLETYDILLCIKDGVPIPDDIIVDVEFRRMAAMAEAEKFTSN